MSKNIRTLYLYLVSLIALGMIVIGCISTIDECASYFFPTIDYYNMTDNKEEALIKERNEKTQSIKSAISSASVAIIGVPLYMYHFGKVQKERKMGE